MSTRPPAVPLLRIQQVAADVGLTTRTIRYYEELGLLKPAARSEGYYRLYDDDDLERLRFIKGLRDDAGFSLAEIGLLLEDEAARARNRERFRSTNDPDERTRDRRGRVRPGRPPDRDRSATRSTDSRRWSTEAEGRRAHLEAHLEEIRTRDRARPARPRAGRRRGHPMTVAPLAGFHGLRAMRHRNYRLFFFGQLISLDRHVDAAGRPGAGWCCS